MYQVALDTGTVSGRAFAMLRKGAPTPKRVADDLTLVRCTKDAGCYYKFIVGISKDPYFLFGLFHSCMYEATSLTSTCPKQPKFYYPKSVTNTWLWPLKLSESQKCITGQAVLERMAP